jgi:y4mF family transcriptional regulator
MSVSSDDDTERMSRRFYLKNAQSVGELVRRARRDQGLDQATLARRVGVSRQWISEIENGKSSAEVALVLRTFAALDLQLFAIPRSSAELTVTHPDRGDSSRKSSSEDPGG